MSGKFSKYFGWSVKLATLIVTIPVTWIVAGELFADVSILYVRYAMQGAAVFGVEGALTRLWYVIESDKQAPFSVQLRRAVFAFILYFGLWALALRHGEGVYGIVFRVTLGLELFGSCYDTFALLWQKANQRTDRSTENNWRVRLHDRWLSIKEAMAERSAMHAVRMQFLNAEKQGGLHAGGLYAERLQDQNVATHDTRSVTTHDTTHDIPRKWDRWIDPRTEAKDGAKTLVAEILQTEPEISNYALAKRVGRSDSTVRRYRQELLTESRNGRDSANA